MVNGLRIISMSETYKGDDRGTFQKFMRVTFKVGDDGPFTHDFPADGFTAATARPVLEQRARELQMLKES
jgi:hypothetical protein